MIWAAVLAACLAVIGLAVLLVLAAVVSFVLAAIGRVARRR